MKHRVGGIAGTEPSWVSPFTGLNPRASEKRIEMLRRQATGAVRPGRP